MKVAVGTGTVNLIGGTGTSLNASGDAVDLGHGPIAIQNLSTGTVYVGNDHTVATTTGYKLTSNEHVLFTNQSLNNCWLVADAANQDVRWLYI